MAIAADSSTVVGDDVEDIGVRLEEDPETEEKSNELEELTEL